MDGWNTFFQGFGLFSGLLSLKPVVTFRLRVFFSRRNEINRRIFYLRDLKRLGGDRKVKKLKSPGIDRISLVKTPDPEENDL